MTRTVFYALSVGGQPGKRLLWPHLTQEAAEIDCQRMHASVKLSRETAANRSHEPVRQITPEQLPRVVPIEEDLAPEVEAHLAELDKHFA